MEWRRRTARRGSRVSTLTEETSSSRRGVSLVFRAAEDHTSGFFLLSLTTSKRGQREATPVLRRTFELHRVTQPPSGVDLVTVLVTPQKRAMERSTEQATTSVTLYHEMAASGIGGASAADRSHLAHVTTLDRPSSHLPFSC